MASGSSLLEPAFVRELEALRRRLLVRARSGAAGDRVAKRRGSSAEFEDHRAYSSGDDLRRIDWLAFARTGEPLIKQFRSEEDAVMRLLLDASASLNYGDPSKFEAARRLAAAFGYLASSGAQRVQLAVSSGADPEKATAQGRLRTGPARRGGAALGSLLRELSECTANGGISLADAIDRALLLSKRPGMLVVLSDFFDPGPVTQALRRASAAGHDLALVQVLCRQEVEPTFEGDYSLVDAETKAEVDVTMDPAAIRAYLARLAGLLDELRQFARRHGAVYVRALSDEPLEGVVRRFVARAID